MSKRPYHHGDLRAAMLWAAEAILDRAGLDGLTLRAAAREAGVSHTAPVHHFGDLSGLLSVLAASGFVRFREHLLAAASTAGRNPEDRLAALGAAYIGFARGSPGLFQLMFRSTRLDWSNPELVQAAEAAFALLTTDVDGSSGESHGGQHLDRLGLAVSRWSLAHGAAMLSVDGRLDAVAAKQGVDVKALITAVVRRMPADSRVRRSSPEDRQDEGPRRRGDGVS